MCSIFKFCNPLSPLSELNKWNTSNIYDMSYLFFFCRELKALPDISKWNTSNVNIKYGKDNMFYGCINNLIVPNIFN